MSFSSKDQSGHYRGHFRHGSASGACTDSQGASTSASSGHPHPPQPQPPHQSRVHQRLTGHRRAKSAGQASSFVARDYAQHYAATGLWAHQSGEQLDSASIASAAASQLWTIAPIVKRTASENTIRQSHEPPPYQAGSYYYPEAGTGGGGYFAHQRKHSSVKYASLKAAQAAAAKAHQAAALEDDLSLESDGECACFALPLPSLQPFAGIHIFVFLCCILVTLQQALSSGYFNSVITTIEKRFDISSQLSGAIVSTFELGNLATIIFVSYFGTHRHIPRWIGTGIVVTALGSILFAAPHFMSLTPAGGAANGSAGGRGDANTCRIPQAHLSSPFLEKASSFINPILGNYEDPTCAEEDKPTVAPQMLVFMIAMVLIGCGGTPIFTLGTTYIDDHVPKESSSMYMGCMYSMVAFGLVCGFLLGGFFINVHENAFGTGVTPADIFPGHPKWIGAWWAGFILLGVLLLLISIPFFIFPKTLKRKRCSEHHLLTSSGGTGGPSALCSSASASSTLKNSSSGKQALVLASEEASPDYAKGKYGRSVGEIPAAMWRLATNPIYLVTCLGSCMELAIVSGFLIFLPKYLETQFSLGKSEANLFAGGIAIPGACLGIFFGGWLLKRLQLTPKGAIQVVLFFNLLCMGLYTALYFLGCENVKMAGTTLPYTNTDRSHLDPFRVNLTAECNLGCRCSSNDLEPVCDVRNKISYYSPCFAGCTSVDSTGKMQNYSNCACLPSLSKQTAAAGGSVHPPPANLHPEVTILPMVIPGPCPQACNAMTPFMILLFFITLVVSITQMPVVMITLRSVEEEERSLALGMQFVLFRLFGYIPSPIVFGKVIDSTCLVWKAHCGQQGGFCLLYNIEQFRLRYVGVCSALKVTAGLLFFLDWLLICYREKRQLKAQAALLQAQASFPADDLTSSIISLDRLSLFAGAQASGAGAAQVAAAVPGPGTVWGANETIAETDEEATQPSVSRTGNGSSAGLGDSDYNSAIEEEEEEVASAEDNSTASSLVAPSNGNQSTLAMATAGDAIQLEQAGQMTPPQTSYYNA